MGTPLENAVDSIKHSVWIGLCTFVGAMGTYLLHYAQTVAPMSLIADLQSRAGLTALAVGAVGAGLTAVLSVIKMPSNAAGRLAGGTTGGNSTGGGGSPPTPPALRRSVLPRIGPLVTALLAVLLLGACLTSAPIAPVTPSNQAQIASCQSTASLHNGVVIGDFVFTGSATGVAGASAFVSDTNAKNALAITGASLGAAALIGSGIAALTSSNFANSKCSSVVGDLPAAAIESDGGATPRNEGGTP